MFSRSFACWRLRTDARERAESRARARRAAFSVPSFDLTHTSQHDLRHACMHPTLVGIAVVRIALDIVLASPGLQLSVTGYSRHPDHLDNCRTAARFRRTQHDSDDPCLARSPRSSSASVAFVHWDRFMTTTNSTNKDNRDRQPSSPSSVSASDPGDRLIIHHS